MQPSISLNLVRFLSANQYSDERFLNTNSVFIGSRAREGCMAARGIVRTHTHTHHSFKRDNEENERANNSAAET